MIELKDSPFWKNYLQGFGEPSEPVAATLIAALDRTAWERMGAANDARLTPRNMLWVLMGHERHHIQTLKELYGIA